MSAGGGDSELGRFYPGALGAGAAHPKHWGGNGSLEQKESFSSCSVINSGGKCHGNGKFRSVLDKCTDHKGNRNS